MGRRARCGRSPTASAARIARCSAAGPSSSLALRPVDERGARAEQRGGLERGLARGRRRRRGVAELAEPASKAPARDRGLARLQERSDGARDRRRCPAPRLHARRAIQLGPEVHRRAPAGTGRPTRRAGAGPRPRRPVAANARTSSTCASSLSGSAPTQARRERDRPPARCRPPAPGAPPPGGRRRRARRSRRRSPSSQASNPGLASTSIPSNSSRPRPGSSTAAAAVPSSRTRHVDRRAARQPEPDRRAAADGLGPTEEAAQLRQVPAQRVRRVLGVREEQRPELLASLAAAPRAPGTRDSAQTFLPRGGANTTPSRSDERRSEQLGDDGHAAMLRRTGATASPRRTLTRPLTRPRPYASARAPDRTGGRPMSAPTVERAANGGSGRGHRAGGRGVRRGAGRAERDDRPAPEGRSCGRRTWAT